MVVLKILGSANPNHNTDPNPNYNHNPYAFKQNIPVPYYQIISTTNLAAVVCVCAKFDQFLPARFYFVSKRPENFVRIAKFP